MRAGEDRALQRVVRQRDFVVVLVPLRLLVRARGERARAERQAADDALELVVPLRVRPEGGRDVVPVQRHLDVAERGRVRDGDLDSRVAAGDVLRRARDDGDMERVRLGRGLIARGCGSRYGNERGGYRDESPSQSFHALPFPCSGCEDYLALAGPGSSGCARLPSRDGAAPTDRGGRAGARLVLRAAAAQRDPGLDPLPRLRRAGGAVPDLRAARARSAPRQAWARAAARGRGGVRRAGVARADADRGRGPPGLGAGRHRARAAPGAPAPEAAAAARGRARARGAGAALCS